MIIYQIIFFSRIQSEKALDDIPVYKNILEKFTTNEIVRQEDFCNQFQAELRETEAFSKSEMGDKRCRHVLVSVRVVLHQSCSGGET